MVTFCTDVEMAWSCQSDVRVRKEKMRSRSSSCCRLDPCRHLTTHIYSRHMHIRHVDSRRMRWSRQATPDMWTSDGFGRKTQAMVSFERNGVRTKRSRFKQLLPQAALLVRSSPLACLFLVLHSYPLKQGHVQH